MTIRIFVALLLALRERLSRRLEQLRETRKNVAEQAGYAQRHVDAGTAELGRRDDVVTRHAARSVVPARRDARQMQGHRKILARGAHGRGAPEIDDEPLRPVAVILQVTTQQFLGELDALRLRRRRGYGAEVDGKQIAARGQHVLAPAIWRAR